MGAVVGTLTLEVTALLTRHWRHGRLTHPWPLLLPLQHELGVRGGSWTRQLLIALQKQLQQQQWPLASNPDGQRMTRLMRSGDARCLARLEMPMTTTTSSIERLLLQLRLSWMDQGDAH